MYYFRDVGARGPGALPPPQVFGRSVNPILTQGADYSNHITTCLPPTVLLTW